MQLTTSSNETICFLSFKQLQIQLNAEKLYNKPQNNRHYWEVCPATSIFSLIIKPQFLQRLSQKKKKNLGHKPVALIFLSLLVYLDSCCLIYQFKPQTNARQHITFSLHFSSAIIQLYKKPGIVLYTLNILGFGLNCLCFSC